AAIKGGATGDAAILPGEPEKSPLYKAITWADESLQMPPKENDRLSAEQVSLIRRWIATGAKWEESAVVTSVPGGIRIATSGGRSSDWDNRTYEPEAVWAYQPIRRLDVPVGNALRGVPGVAGDGDLRMHPIDAFLLAALKAKGIDGFAPPLDAGTLVRR